MIVHITPNNDIYAHIDTILCPCQPYVDIINPDIIQHIAYDAREFEEISPYEEWFYIIPHTPSTCSH